MLPLCWMLKAEPLPNRRHVSQSILIAIKEEDEPRLRLASIQAGKLSRSFSIKSSSSLSPPPLLLSSLPPLPLFPPFLFPPFFSFPFPLFSFPLLSSLLDQLPAPQALSCSSSEKVTHFSVVFSWLSPRSRLARQGILNILVSGKEFV